jgi:hypothetical protein
MLQGRNLIIAINGSTIAAAKSCSVEVQADTIKVSSPTDGAWEHIIAGRKSWQVQTSHLMPNAASAYSVEGMAQANNGVTTPAPSTLRVGIHTYTIAQRGLTLYGINTDGSNAVLIGNVDTYVNTDTACQQFADLITGTSYVQLAIVSYDAYGMTDALKTVIASNLHVDMTGVQMGACRDALVVIGDKGDTRAGIMQYHHEEVGVGGTARASLNFYNTNGINPATILKPYIGKVGTEVTLRMQVDGYGNDYVTGQAIVTAFKSQGSIGNLLTGAFTFKGNGPLV